VYRKLVACASAALLIGSTAASGAQQASPQPNSSPNGPDKTVLQALQAPKPNTLLDGTPVRLRLGRTISSADCKQGDEVDFEVLDDVAVNQTVIIAKGALAIATVTEAEHKKSMGRAGKLNVNIDSVRLVDQEKAALRATEGGKGGGHVGAMTGAMVATSIVFFPAAPLFLFIHGKDITIPKGTEVTAYVNGDMTLDMAKFKAAGITESVDSVLSQVAVDANQANCDIEVDGNFVGNTPSQLSLVPGKHQITVRKKGYADWTRTLTVSGSGIHLNAELEAAVVPTSQTALPASASAVSPSNPR
jgi:PEGA domain